MAQPRVAAFARLANGNVAPARIIEGARTRLARTSHAIAFDEINDEILVPNPFAQAILFFRGGADGDEAPVRVIQGPRTRLQEPDELALDNIHDEVIVPARHALLVYPRDASGDVAPKRIITGPKTMLHANRGIAIDPVNDIIAVGNRNPRAILIFKRSAEGDVAPLSVITGPNTGIHNTKGFWVIPETKELVAAVEARGAQDSRQPGHSFIGVWNYSDTGNVAPKIVLQGERTGLIAPRGSALNPARTELYVIDKIQNALFTFDWQQIIDSSR